MGHVEFDRADACAQAANGLNTTLLIVAGVFAFGSVFFLAKALGALRGGKPVKSVNRLVLFVLCLAVAGVFGGVAVGTYGYRALTKEETVALIEIERLPKGRFSAVFVYPDGGRQVFDLAGDEIYVDARILKWKAPANLLGLHTAFELDRVAGRYARVEDERERPRSVFPVSPAGPVDLFYLRHKFPVLEPLVDAEYGSASYVTAKDGVTLELRVSTTGLLLRDAPADASAP
jgi:hypothetical protein